MDGTKGSEYESLLEMRHHYEISRHLKELDNDQIVEVGTALGMNHSKLKRMRSLPGDMVAAWLRREDDVLEVGVPTWKVLARMLSDTGQTGLARKIQQKYQHGMTVGEEDNACSFTIGGENLKASQISPVKSSGQQSEADAKLELCPSMTEEQFFTFLREEKLPDDDCRILRDNKIQAKTFVNYLSVDDIDSDDALGKFTYIGKKLLKRLLRQGSTTTESSNHKDSSSASGLSGGTCVTSLSTSQDDDSAAPIEFNENDRKKISVDGRNGKKIAFDCFDPYSINHSIAPRPVKFTFGEVKPNNTKERVSVVSTYDMNHFPHGVALIINNEIFFSKTMRKGTAIDERNLTHVFRYLGYKVEVHRDQKSLEMLEIMFEMGKRNHEMYDSFVCCILSHGAEGQVYGIDGEKILLHALTEMVDATHCRTLRGKPKLFFLQACRGDLREVAVNVSTDSGKSMLPHYPQSPTSSGAHPVATDSDNEIPSLFDFFLGHATPLGYVAWRDEDHGSWYVSELCRCLCEMYRYASLDDIMTEVCKHVGEKYEHVGYKVSTESTTRLQKKVYF